MSFIRRTALPAFKKWEYAKIFHRYSSSAVATNLNFKANDKSLGYLVKKVEQIHELNLTAVHLEHERTQAQHLHLACDDPNNCFGVMLQTAPSDSTGVPHILEHLTLSGSQKYPCRDPFMNMINRSLSTFMNAMTAPDHTIYVFSSQNRKDFYNLMSVYLDAVFRPLLTENDFRQEGWRLEHEDVQNKTSPIVFKGVVFNEMKGVFSDPNQYYARSLMNELYPDTPYSHESGGDPLHIPQLSWENLRRFHSHHYHPSNARFLTYGNLPLEDHLEKIESSILNHFECHSNKSIVPDVKRWSSPKEVTIYNRFDPMAANPDKQTIVSNTYLLENITNTHESFVLSILGILLTDGPNAPFYQNLLQSGIGPDYSPYTGYISFVKESAFSVGLREISENDVCLVKDIIETTFKDVAKTGFPDEQIHGVLHNVELSTKHKTSNFGLNCLMGVSSMWNHHGDPINAFKVNDHVRWFKQQMEDNPNFLQDKIQKYFVNNNHMLTLVMKPKEEFEKLLLEDEKELLESRILQLTPEQKLIIYEQGVQLAEHQKKNDVSCLPTLKIEDVKRTTEKTNLSFEKIGTVPIQLCEQLTNGVVYFKGLLDASHVSVEDIALLPLFCSIVTEMGTHSRNYKDLDRDIQLKTGGLDVSLHISENPEDSAHFRQEILFQSYCLEKNVPDMFSLWKDVLKNLCLDDSERLSQLIRLRAAELAQGLSNHGHVYAMQRASSSLGLCANRKETAFGFTQAVFMKQLAESADHKEIQEKLKKLAAILFNTTSPRCSLNATSQAMPVVLKSLDCFLKDTEFSKSPLPKNSLPLDFKTGNHQTHIVLPFSVNCLGQSIPTIPYAHKDYASLKVAAKLMSAKFLHSEIREKGGAYGGGAKLNKSGHFMFYSYRDPNTSKTLQNFALGVDWLLQSNYPQQHIDEAKLGVFGEVDGPVIPGAKGSLLFLGDISHEMKETFRQRIFDCSKQDIVDVAQKYLKDCSSFGVSLIGPENELTKSDARWNIISKDV